MMQTTFVTAFMNIYDQPLHNVRDVAWRFDHFSKLAETGIHICVYVDSYGEMFMQQFIELFPDTIKIMRVMEIYDTWIHQECKKYLLEGSSIQLPEHRTVTKDTYNYMVLMNSKIEFLYDAIQKNPWNTKKFAWIDFNIWHVFRDYQDSSAFINLLSISLSSDLCDFLAIPGCWSKLQKDENPDDKILNRIHWRFCGGFLLGTSSAILNLWDLYQEYWPLFLERFGGHMVWEVNFWAWLEANAPDWNPIWFAADHDDRIIQVPIETITLCLATDMADKTEVTLYPYKHIPGFLPMSASVTTTPDGCQKMLNTRYVNYRLTETGAYLFYHPDRVISTKNIFSILDNDWMPVSYQLMSDPSPSELPSKDIPACPFDGIEDIRIWWLPSLQQTFFLGTSINYSTNGSNRMILGTYDIVEYRLHDCFVLEPPGDSYCEKNWCPIILQDTNVLEDVQFIYKWSPLEIGVLKTIATLVDNEEVPKRKRLEIVTTHHVAAPVFRRFRGSTCFIESQLFPGMLIGVAHFSQNEWPRHYYHSVILLDKQTLKPKAYTPTFTFCKTKTIEFCIGFSEEVRGGLDNVFRFWISQFDRDPCMVTTRVSAFSWCQIL